MRAYVWTLDDEVAGIVGIVRAGTYYVGFSDVTERMLPLLQTFAARRAAIKVLRWVRQSKLRVFAEAYTGEGYHGHELLVKLGFVPLEEKPGFVTKDILLWRG